MRRDEKSEASRRLDRACIRRRDRADARPDASDAAIGRWDGMDANGGIKKSGERRECGGRKSNDCSIQ